MNNIFETPDDYYSLFGLTLDQYLEKYKELDKKELFNRIIEASIRVGNNNNKLIDEIWNRAEFLEDKIKISELVLKIELDLAFGKLSEKVKNWFNPSKLTINTDNLYCSVNQAITTSSFGNALSDVLKVAVSDISKYNQILTTFINIDSKTNQITSIKLGKLFKMYIKFCYKDFRLFIDPKLKLLWVGTGNIND